VIDRLGHDPRSPYAEQFWLPILGPSASWLLRRIAERFDAEPAGFSVHLTEAAREIGLGTKGGRHGPLLHTVDRLGSFGLLQRVEPTLLATRRRVPPLTRAQVNRLPSRRRADHDRWLEIEDARRRHPSSA
jgi:hypothetical protein